MILKFLVVSSLDVRHTRKLIFHLRRDVIIFLYFSLFYHKKNRQENIKKSHRVPSLFTLAEMRLNPNEASRRVMHKSKSCKIKLFAVDVVVNCFDCTRLLALAQPDSMKFYFALFHFNKCYHHRLEWKKVIENKKERSVFFACYNSTDSMPDTMWRKIHFSFGRKILLLVARREMLF